MASPMMTYILSCIKTIFLNSFALAIIFWLFLTFVQGIKSFKSFYEKGFKVPMIIFVIFFGMMGYQFSLGAIEADGGNCQNKNRCWFIHYGAAMGLSIFSLIIYYTIYYGCYQAYLTYEHDSLDIEKKLSHLKNNDFGKYLAKIKVPEINKYCSSATKFTLNLCSLFIAPWKSSISLKNDDCGEMKRTCNGGILSGLFSDKAFIEPDLQSFQRKIKSKNIF